MAARQAQTRAQILRNVLTNVLGKGEATGLHKAVIENGIGDVDSLTNLRENDIENLTCTDDDDEEKQLSIGDRSLIRVLIAYQHYAKFAMTQEDATIGRPSIDWGALTPEAFNSFRISEYDPAVIMSEVFPLPATTRRTSETRKLST